MLICKFPIPGLATMAFTHTEGFKEAEVGCLRLLHHVS